jgi:hypothetical protein
MARGQTEFRVEVADEAPEVAILHDRRIVSVQRDHPSQIAAGFSLFRPLMLAAGFSMFHPPQE